MYMKGLNDAQNPGAIPLDTFMMVSSTGQSMPVVDNTNVFEANFPAQPQGSGLTSAPKTILGMQPKTALMVAVAAIIVAYFLMKRKD